MRTTFEEFKKKALTDPEVKKEYQELSSAYALRKQLIRIRKNAGLTQEEIAGILRTKKSNISRLENVHSTSSPRLATIEKYAKAAGYDLQINFVPQNST
jgi:ribosome-binding protein aMBF1 (putative translation factor)